MGILYWARASTELGSAGWEESVAAHWVGFAAAAAPEHRLSMLARFLAATGKLVFGLSGRKKPTSP